MCLLFSQQNPDVVMLSFRNLSYENDVDIDGEQEYHMENGVVHNGTVNNIDNNNSLHKLDVPVSNGSTGEYAPRDRKNPSRDLSRVLESSHRSNKCRWRCKITANGIDAWSRVLFPLAYGLFIVAYWIIYSPNTGKENS